MNEKETIIKVLSSSISEILDFDNSSRKADLLLNIVDYLDTVDNEQKYKTIKKLIEANKLLKKPIWGWNNHMFTLCNDEYRFRMWKDGYVNYCPADELKTYFKNQLTNIQSHHNVIIAANGNHPYRSNGNRP